MDTAIKVKFKRSDKARLLVFIRQFNDNNIKGPILRTQEASILFLDVMVAIDRLIEKFIKEVKDL